MLIVISFISLLTISTVDCVADHSCVSSGRFDDGSPLTGV